MSSRAARKRVFVLANDAGPAFRQVSTMRKRQRVQREPGNMTPSVHPPTWPLFTFTSALRDSLPNYVSDEQRTQDFAPPDDSPLHDDAHIPEEEELPLFSAASGKVHLLLVVLSFTQIRVQGQNEMLTDWLNTSASSYLLNTLRSESIHEQGLHCVQCELPCDALFQCRDCLHQWGKCAPCLRQAHFCLPGHRYRKWVGTHFENTDSSEIGFVFQLGHAGKPCDMGFERVFVLGDTNGLHNITIRFCRHPGRGSPSKQLMDSNIFPCSDLRPQTGFTFNVLRLFCFMSAKSKLSAQRFYNVLVCLTNSTFPKDVPDRYCEFMQVARQWQWLQAVKRSGSTSPSSSPSGPLQGDLALRCPACPHEGINFERTDIVDGDE
jgi:hypothetical protein